MLDSAVFSLIPWEEWQSKDFGFEIANANININIGGNCQKTLNICSSQNLSLKRIESKLSAAPDLQGKITTPSSLVQYPLHPQQQQQIHHMQQSAGQLISKAL
jgi:Fe-S cluster biogenesis protein NfuA